MQSPAPVTVNQLLAPTEGDLELKICAGHAGLERQIAIPRIQKPGLALTGYTEQLHPNRLLVMGGTEIDYLASVSEGELEKAVGTVMASEPACIVITRGLEPPSTLARTCEAAGVPLLVSQLSSAELIGRVTTYLADLLAPRASVHGVMLDVLGVGILIMGKSGIGKSETALDLVSRGHRLVADDVVEIRRPSPKLVFGVANSLIRHHLEIRGLGIINIKDLFGISSIREAKRIELVVELVEWDKNAHFDRLGVDDEFYSALGVPIPMLRLPVRPGRAMATIIEVAARNQLLKIQGHHSAREFQERMEREIPRAMPGRYNSDLIE